jgi:hypothetical protein
MNDSIEPDGPKRSTYLHIRLRCRFCETMMEAWTELVGEPKPEEFVTVYCPNDGTPFPIQLKYFKPAEVLPPGVQISQIQTKKPSRPFHEVEKLESLEQPPKRWWQFWR